MFPWYLYNWELDTHKYSFDELKKNFIYIFICFIAALITGIIGITYINIYNWSIFLLILSIFAFILIIMLLYECWLKHNGKSGYWTYKTNI